MSERKRKFGLKPQLLLLLFVLNLVAASAYSLVLYRIDRAEILIGIDNQLRTAAYAVKEIVPPGYHERIRHMDSISPEEFDALQDRLSGFANASGLSYAYTYMKFGAQIRTVATSATVEEMRAGSQTRYFALYDTAPAKLHRSFVDHRIRYDEYSDAFGRFRSIYTPVRMRDGRTYVIGADIDLGHLDAKLRAALLQSIGVGVVMFALSLAIGWLLIGRIVQPLTRLTAFTRSMEERSFEPDEQELAEIRQIGGSRGDEVGSLAEAMSGMIARLQRYLMEVETATAARERVEGELTAARDIQLGMLPGKFPPFPDRTDIDVFAMLEPAKQVGGDLYDYFLIDRDRLFFVVGDVAGKGVPAALFMAMTTTLFKAQALSVASTAEIMNRVNAELARDNVAEMFVTAFACILDLRDGSVTYSDAGHEAPFLVRADGRVERLVKKQGIAMGIFADVAYQADRFTLAPGDALVLFTDGVSEATGPDDELFTVDRIRTALDRTRSNPSARYIVEGLADSVRAFVGEVPQSDDIAILVVCYEGPTRP
ncbi:MAG: SpoIIE family protein phosphatase [Sphingopyxis sp.]|uniref:PP2C family protein-serine/threonine phosphatase n=1 Tax=Sphingopyxis sp. TaxID=1908224 RepID=UPI002AB839FC|nr:SpoIIE family protein phosphatase [Sphingopyxis sp.]MDZ3832702.1 SpoIIE family protein phosphatase [Sphingopyxis sp.]